MLLFSQKHQNPRSEQSCINVGHPVHLGFWVAFPDSRQIIGASTSWRALRQKVQAFEMAFLVFGGLAAGAGVLLALTVYGVIVWKKKLKNAALVEKMLWDTQPSEHQYAESVCIIYYSIEH